MGVWCIHYPSLSHSPDKVGADFTLEVEVYCSLPPEEPVPHNKPSTPIKMLKRLRGNKVVSLQHSWMNIKGADLYPV